MNKWPLFKTPYNCDVSEMSFIPRMFLLLYNSHELKLLNSKLFVKHIKWCLDHYCSEGLKYQLQVTITGIKVNYNHLFTV